jgi:hypothetical protein
VAFLIALFNLKDGVSSEVYELWAKSTDIPTVRTLPSNLGFDVFRAVSVRGSDRAPPYQYIEVIEISDMDRFGSDVATDKMREIAAQFREFADAPIFVACDKLEV